MLRTSDFTEWSYQCASTKLTQLLRFCNTIAFALRFHGRKRVHNADEFMAEIVARRLVEHLERAGFVIGT